MATPEATALDLLRYLRAAGHLGHVATVLGDLAERLDVDGAREVRLGALGREPGVKLGLLTGNLEPCARLKLEPIGANRFFAFGAFGSDDEDRYRLAPVALARACDLGLAMQLTNIARDIGEDARHPELCGRCVSNLEGPGETRRFA